MSRILIVDDEIAIQEMVGAIIFAWGYQVETASGANEALTKIASQDFDLILTDIRMDHGSGTELCRQLRESGHSLPIIAMSGFVENQKDELLNIGFDLVIDKPFNFPNLKASIEFLLDADQQTALKSAV